MRVKRLVGRCILGTVFLIDWVGWASANDLVLGTEGLFIEAMERYLDCRFVVG